jgi:hypothetical protein
MYWGMEYLGSDILSLVVATLSFSIFFVNSPKAIGSSLLPFIMTSVVPILMTSSVVVLLIYLELVADLDAIDVGVGVFSLCPMRDWSTFVAKNSGRLYRTLTGD